MTQTHRLCFGRTGLLNPEVLHAVRSQDAPVSLALFGDGSLEALRQIQTFTLDPLFTNLNLDRIGIGHLPIAMRVLGQDGIRSQPHFLFSDDMKAKWICNQIASPRLELTLYSATSKAGTKVRLDKKQKDAVCLMAYELWQCLLTAEEQLRFPAAIIDALSRYTYQLSPDIIREETLREILGLVDVSYNRATDMLMVGLQGETFTVKLRVLNDVYGSVILPKFNKLQGRKMRLLVSIKGAREVHSEEVEMGFGELGRLIDSMAQFVEETPVSVDDPMPEEDLLQFVAQVEANNESCHWFADLGDMEQMVSQTIAAHLGNSGVTDNRLTIIAA